MISGLFRKLGGESLAARTRRGSILTVLQFGSGNVIRLVSNLILTRLLFPEAFGLMALVQVVTAGLAMFSDIGLHASLIQNKRAEEPAFFNTAWTIQILRGLVLAGATVLISPYVADFYDEPMLAELLPVAALTAVVAGFRPTKVVTVNRNMQLGRLTVIDICNQIVSLALTILLVWWTGTVWGLVYGMVLGAVIRNISLRLFLPGVGNRLCWEWSAVRELIGFGKYIFISTFASFVVQNADKAILGRFITIDALGVYTIALTFASIPRMLIRSLTWRIVFPLYSKRRPDQDLEDRRKIFRARYAMTGVVMLGSVLLVVFGKPLIEFLYDPRYYDAAPMTILVAIGFMPLLVVHSYDPILLANGRSDLHAVLTIVHALLKVGALYILILDYGVVGAALSPILSTLLYYPLMVVMTRKYRAWDPVHDMLWFAVTLAVILVTYWYIGDTLSELTAGRA